MKPAWIYSKPVDIGFILLPAFVVSALPWFFPSSWLKLTDLPPLTWVALVLLIDVAHVYATLFRAWFDPSERERLGVTLWMILAACWGFGVALYSWGPNVFWRALAYLAVFHFVRQQFGFVRLYSRKENSPQAWWRTADALFIYAATGFPLLFWHLHSDRTFSWFVTGDFLLAKNLPPGIQSALTALGGALFAATAIALGAREFQARKKYGRWNGPRIAVALGTALSWNIGIVLFNSDLIFTMTNVIAHGIPYMALTWGYSRLRQVPFARKTLWQFAMIFLAVIICGAYVEEFLWDNLVWNEHSQIFPRVLDAISDPTTLAWLVPLLALPQSSHYVLDGFIWKVRSTPVA